MEYIRDHYPRPDGRPLRIAIVDTDVHHGDGSQDIFWNDPHTLLSRYTRTAAPSIPALAFSVNAAAPAHWAAPSTSPCRRKPPTKATSTPSPTLCCPCWKISSPT